MHLRLWVFLQHCHGKLIPICTLQLLGRSICCSLKHVHYLESIHMQSHKEQFHPNLKGDDLFLIQFSKCLRRTSQLQDWIGPEIFDTVNTESIGVWGDLQMYQIIFFLNGLRVGVIFLYLFGGELLSHLCFFKNFYQFPDYLTKITKSIQVLQSI